MPTTTSAAPSALPSQRFEAAADDLAVPLVQARLFAAAESFTAGSETLLAVQLVIAPGWHLYWRGANDTGLPLSASWEVPAGVDVGPLRWPAPQRHQSPGELLDHVYFDELTVLTSVVVPRDQPAGDLTLAVQLDWLVCAATCLPGSAQLELTLPLRPAGTQQTANPHTKPTPDAARIEAALAALPGAAPPQLSLEWSADLVRLTVPGARRLAFFPRDDCLPLAELLTRGEASSDTLQLLRDHGFSGGERLIGILAVRTEIDAPASHHMLDLAPPQVPDHNSR